MELKPCPFCGSKDPIRVKDTDYVECRDCGGFGPDDDPLGEKWNAAPRQGGETTRQQLAVEAWKIIVASDLKNASAGADGIIGVPESFYGYTADVAVRYADALVARLENP